MNFPLLASSSMIRTQLAPIRLPGPKLKGTGRVVCKPRKSSSAASSEARVSVRPQRLMASVIISAEAFMRFQAMRLKSGIAPSSGEAVPNATKILEFAGRAKGTVNEPGIKYIVLPSSGSLPDVLKRVRSHLEASRDDSSAEETSGVATARGKRRAAKSSNA